MKLTVSIDLDGAAFEVPGPEVAMMLRKLSSTLYDMEPGARSHPLRLRDTMGNTCGEARITEQDPDGYMARELGQVDATGPESLRLKVTGAELQGMKWVRITPEQFERITAILTESGGQ